MIQSAALCHSIWFKRLHAQYTVCIPKALKHKRKACLLQPYSSIFLTLIPDRAAIKSASMRRHNPLKVDIFLHLTSDVMSHSSTSPFHGQLSVGEAGNKATICLEQTLIFHTIAQYNQLTLNNFSFSHSFFFSESTVFFEIIAATARQTC